MKIIIAPDSFKGSLSAVEVSEAIEKGIRKCKDNLEIEKVPMADGGEGTVESLVSYTNGEIVNIKVKGPLLREVDAFYGILGDKETAIIEMASASGLPLIDVKERNPMKTTTYGTGELILEALDKGCRKFIIGLGGSATNDGGSGMVMALGAMFLDKEGNSIKLGAEGLRDLEKIDINNMDKRLKECTFTVACDVDNPLCGERGASCVFGPQKGADKDMVEKLDYYLENYAKIIKRDLGLDVVDVKGAGAAGGMGAATIAFLNGKLQKGIDIMIEMTNLKEKIKNADLVITGEGMIDYQTAYGKTPYGVAKVAKEYDIPVIGICGSIGERVEELYEACFDSIFSIIDKPMSLEEAIKNSKELLESAAERIMRVRQGDGSRVPQNANFDKLESEKMSDIIFLDSEFKEKIWGGNRLREYFGYDIPSDNTGEYWAVSGHTNGDSTIRNGQFKGKKLSWLWDNHREVFGGLEGKEFPLLTKIIDASDNLSVQVHPGDEYAKENENGSLGKTECWYIIDCDKDAELVLGHSAKSKEQMKEMIEEGKWDDLLRRVKIKPGDFFYIPAGTIHAIGKGTMILETQQSSDITYRVYDYDRLQNGKPRELHIKESIDVTTVPHRDAKSDTKKEEINDNTIETLVEAEYFSVYKGDINSSIELKQDKPFMIMSVLKGEGSIDGIDIKKGDHFIIPAEYGEFKLEGDMEIIYSHS